MAPWKVAMIVGAALPAYALLWAAGSAGFMWLVGDNSELLKDALAALFWLSIFGIAAGFFGALLCGSGDR
jgi:hypothetical protein